MVSKLNIVPLRVDVDENGAVVASGGINAVGKGYLETLRVFRKHYVTDIKNSEVASAQHTRYDLARRLVARTTVVEETFSFHPDYLPGDEYSDSAVSNMETNVVLADAPITNMNYETSDAILARIEAKIGQQELLTIEDLNSNRARLDDWLKSSGFSEDRTG